MKALTNGIDVSKHQGTAIDWAKVKASGVDFVIIRAGYGRYASQEDPQFDANYKGAKAAGLDVGVYWYSYATTNAEAEAEAAVCLQVIKGKKLDYPVYIDIEEKKQLALGRSAVSNLAEAFCKKLETAGYFAGVYMSASPATTYLTAYVKTRFALWIADWAGDLSFTGSVGMWQYSESGKVDGIPGPVDLNRCYIDYPGIIRRNGLNGNRAEQSKPVNPYKAGTKTLRKGAEGDAVRWLQWELHQLGYDLGKAGIDGDFGPATEKAVKAYQADKGLAVDGICGPKTRAALKK